MQCFWLPPLKKSSKNSITKTSKILLKILFKVLLIQDSSLCKFWLKHISLKSILKYQYHFIFNSSTILFYLTCFGAVIVVIVWYKKKCSRIYNYLCNQYLSPLMLCLNPALVRCTWYNIMWNCFSLTCYRSVVFSTNKTDHHDITEILLKVALNTIPPSLQV